MGLVATEFAKSNDFSETRTYRKLVHLGAIHRRCAPRMLLEGGIERRLRVEAAFVQHLDDGTLGRAV